MIYRTKLVSLVILALSLSACAKADTPHSACLSSDITLEQMGHAKEERFETLDRQMASALVDCLAHPDPRVRDGIAYEGLTALLRAGTMLKGDIRAVQDQLLSMITANEPNGFSAPFAALVLSEVARTDRVDPYLTKAERSRLVQAAATYVTGISDYCGFSNTDGWRDLCFLLR